MIFETAREQFKKTAQITKCCKCKYIKDKMGRLYCVKVKMGIIGTTGKQLVSRCKLTKYGKELCK